MKWINSCKQQMEKHISKSIKILFKKQKICHIWTKDTPPFPPAPYPDSVLWFRLQSLSLPLTCCQRAFPGRSSMSLCLILTPAVPKEAESQASVVEKLKFLLPLGSHLPDRVVHLGCDGLRTLRSWSSVLSLAHESVSHQADAPFQMFKS